MGQDTKQDIKQTEENKTGVKAEYPYNAEEKMKECKYCRVMIPKKAKICPNCKSELKRHWFWNLLIVLLVLALFGAAAAGGYHFFYLPNQAAEKAAVETLAASEDTASEANNADGLTTESNTASEAEIQPTATIEAPKAEDDKAEASMAKPADTEDNKAEKSMAEPADTDADKTEVPVEMTEVVLGETDMLGADGTILDFADEKQIIFHDYCGLFVYSMSEQKITASFALEPIGCQYTQGDAVCQVTVREDGKMVYLHPANAAEMYLYDTEKNLLTKKAYSKNNTGKLFAAKETEKIAVPDYTVYRSGECAELAKDTYLYLESGSGLFTDLYYVIEEDKERIDREDIFATEENAMSKEDETAESQEASLRMDAGNDKQQENTEEMQTVEEEQAYKESCMAASYKALLRQSEEYLDMPVWIEVTLLEKVSGGLFDKNSYYLCVSEDKQGITRYWILRDDRAADDLILLEGDTICVYGALFDTCKLSADMVSTQPVVPALAMKYCDLLAE